ncbi:DivIVA domain-containing protein [Streptomyces sp. NPDC001774]
MYTPDDIDQRQFATTRLKEGYDQEEVDHFLDGVAADYRAYLRTVAELEAKLRHAEEPVTQVLPATPSLQSIERLLVVAQQTADQTVADAQVEAESVRAAAQADAERMVTDAQARADQLVAEADGKVAEREAKVTALQEREQYYRTWLRNALSAFEREFPHG